MGTESLTATTSDAAAQEGTVGVNAVLKAQGRTTRTRRASKTRTTPMSIDTALEHRLAQGDQILLVLDEAHTLRKDAAQAPRRSCEWTGRLVRRRPIKPLGKPNFDDGLAR